MASSTSNSPVGFPGPVVLGTSTGATSSALFNDMNIIIPDLIPELYDRYGAENYGMLIEFMGEIGGALRSVTETGTSTTRQFYHYEKGRAFPSAITTGDQTGATAGASVTVTFTSTSLTNSGAENGFQPNTVGYIGSTGIKFQVGTVTATTAVLKPVSTTQSLASLGQASTLKSGETLLLVGNQAAGEASTQMLATNSLIYKITGSTTEIRDDYPITDVAKMNATPINFGGGNYSYYKLGQTELNKRFMYSVENAVIEGVAATNLSNGSIGTLGIIPQVSANGPTVDYTIGSMAIGDLQALARALQYSGGKGEVHILQETNQQDDIDTLLFGKYNAGAISYASVGGTEKAAVSYGFKSFNIKGSNMHFWVYANFSMQTVYGITPTLGAARANYGLVIPQGVTPDARSGTLQPNMQWVYQEVTPGTRFHTYESGGLAAANKTTTMNLVLTQICYAGTRCKAPQQFAQFQGTY